jgi:hypothetical protein
MKPALAFATTSITWLQFAAGDLIFVVMLAILTLPPLLRWRVGRAYPWFIDFQVAFVLQPHFCRRMGENCAAQAIETRKLSPHALHAPIRQTCFATCVNALRTFPLGSRLAHLGHRT